MLFISVEDFLAQVRTFPRLDREQEKALARRMAEGDCAARDALICGNMYLAAAYFHRAPQDIRTLSTVYACLAALEKGIDSFHFLQDSETFSHHMSWRLRQCITRCIAEKGR